MNSIIEYQFNLFHWENYLLNSGKKTVELFDKLIEEDIQNIDIFCDLINKLHSQFCPSPSETQWIVDSISDALSTIKDYPQDTFEEFDAEELWEDYSESLAKDGVLRDKKIFGEFLYQLPCLSTMLAINKPHKYIPYYFQGLYNVLESICVYFNIELPQCPKRTEYRLRFNHYFDISQAFQLFRQALGWTPSMLWAFIYDYAPKAIGGKGWIWNELPKPRTAYFIGTKLNDAFLPSDDSDKKFCTMWQANPNAQPGDIHIMYITSPASKIQYIWKSVAPGFNDPFFYYYRCAYLSKFLKVPSLTFEEIKKDSQLCNMPIVRKNMQGLNGVEILPADFNKILSLLTEKGFKNTEVDLMSEVFTNEKFDFKKESDVEIHLLEPLLKKLGWLKEDYVRQMPLRMGRTSIFYPDYAILPTFVYSKETAYWVWEAKLSIRNNSQLDLDFGQAVSYARRLNSKGICLISIEGVWVANSHDDFSKTSFFSWNDLSDLNTFGEFKKITGKVMVKQKSKT